jgi:ferrochelatase
MSDDYDALLVVSFGGPEGMDDVMPFLRNVTRGRGIPEDRLAEVGRHYESFGGVSPHNEQIKSLIDALHVELQAFDHDLPIYWGNRNWKPMLADTLKQMKADGIRKPLQFVASTYSSYSSCRQYREDVERAQEEVGFDVGRIDKIRAFFNHPGFIETMRLRVAEALEPFPEDKRDGVRLVFTAHSIPLSMAQGCVYEAQLKEASRLVAQAFEGHGWDLVYQSRSGPPQVPWLEPDVCDHLESIHADGVNDVVLIPIGFISDHLEVLYDLDTEARELCDKLGMNMQRAGTVGTHPRFVKMIRELVEERRDPTLEKLTLGDMGPKEDICPDNCCLAPPKRPTNAGRPGDSGVPGETQGGAHG